MTFGQHIALTLAARGHDEGSQVWRYVIDIAQDVAMALGRAYGRAQWSKIQPPDRETAALNVVTLAEREIARGVRRVRA